MPESQLSEQPSGRACSGLSAIQAIGISATNATHEAERAGRPRWRARSRPRAAASLRLIARPSRDATGHRWNSVRLRARPRLYRDVRVLSHFETRAERAFVALLALVVAVRGDRRLRVDAHRRNVARRVAEPRRTGDRRSRLARRPRRNPAARDQGSRRRRQAHRPRARELAGRRRSTRPCLDEAPPRFAADR